MKITKIETFVCNARMRNWIFVKVQTDQPGLHGWGEATLEWHTRAVVGAVVVVGAEPDGPCAERGDELLDEVEPRRIGRRQRREQPGRRVEDVGGGARRSARVTAGDRVAGYEALVFDGGDAALRRADVGHRRVR